MTYRRSHYFTSCTSLTSRRLRRDDNRFALVRYFPSLRKNVVQSGENYVSTWKSKSLGTLRRKEREGKDENRMNVIQMECQSVVETAPSANQQKTFLSTTFEYMILTSFLSHRNVQHCLWRHHLLFVYFIFFALFFTRFADVFFDYFMNYWW